MTQLTKLGDVAKYLRVGDEFRLFGVTRKFCWETASGAMVETNGEEHLVLATHGVELVNPRWVPWGQADTQGNEVTLAHGRVSTWDEFSGMVDGGVMILVRDTDGHREPVRAETREALPRWVTGHDLRAGDLIRMNDDPGPGSHLVTGIDLAAEYAVELHQVGRSGVSGNYLNTPCYLVSRDNPIPGDAPQPTDALPRLVKGSELRVGDEYRYPRQFSEWRVTRAWDDESEGQGVCVRAGGGRALGERSSFGYEHNVELLSRAEAQPAPTLDHDRLRHEWDLLAARTPWAAMAAMHVQRDWAFSRAPYPDQAVARDLKATASDLVGRALRTAAQCAKIGRIAAGPECHMLVVIESETVLLFAEALNGAAYRAKCAEIWPVAVKVVEKPPACGNCGAMCEPDGTRCGDCLSDTGRLFDPSGPTHRSEGRFRGLASPAPDNLTPAQRYHLEDDPDTYGIPGGHH